MNIESLRSTTARTIAAGILAATEGHHTKARECVDGALLGLVALGSQGVQDTNLIERVARLEGRLTQA